MEMHFVFLLLENESYRFSCLNLITVVSPPPRMCRYLHVLFAQLCDLHCGRHLLGVHCWLFAHIAQHVLALGSRGGCKCNPHGHLYGRRQQ